MKKGSPATGFMLLLITGLWCPSAASLPQWFGFFLQPHSFRTQSRGFGYRVREMQFHRQFLRPDLGNEKHESIHEMLENGDLMRVLFENKDVKRRFCSYYESGLPLAHTTWDQETRNKRSFFTVESPGLNQRKPSPNWILEYICCRKLCYSNPIHNTYFVLLVFMGWVQNTLRKSDFPVSLKQSVNPQSEQFRFPNSLAVLAGEPHVTCKINIERTF